MAKRSSGMASHHEILKANRRARRKRFFHRVALVALLAVLALFFGGWYLWNVPALALNQIVITGTERVSLERITAAADAVLAGQYWGLFRRQVNWFYPRAALLATLRREFPELAAIEVTNFSFGTLRIDVTERQPAALWCSEGCYFADNTGLLYAPAPEFSNAPFFTLLGPALPIPLGSRPLPISDWQRLLDLRASVNRLLRTTHDFSSETIAAVVLTEPADYIFKVRDQRRESHSWQLLVARRESAAATAARLAAALSAPAFLNEYRSASTTLESLDVRFDQKVFYKFM